MKSTTASTATETIISSAVVTDDWESFVSVSSDTPIITTTINNDHRMTPTKHENDGRSNSSNPTTNTTTNNHQHYLAPISNNSSSSGSTAHAASPWEDASYTLLLTSSSSPINPPTNTIGRRPYFGRFTRGCTNNNNNNNRDQLSTTSSRNPDDTTTDTTQLWTREYNLSNALQYTERMTLQLRYIILYVTSVWDIILAMTITIYIIRIFYHQYYNGSDNDNNDASATRIHSNYTITKILMSGFIIQITLLYVRCGIIFTIKNHWTDWDHHCRLWLTRCITIGLILRYMISSITFLVTWNILHLPALRQFLLFDDDHYDDSHTKYNIQTYWLLHPTWIRYLQNHHFMNYLYLLLLFCGIVEMIRYAIAQSYFSAILLHHQNNENHIHDDDEYHRSMEEALLPSRMLWYENDPPTTTTTSTWRTTTINHDYFGWKWHKTTPAQQQQQQPSSSSTTTTTTTRRNNQILDPIQFQTIQEEWNYRKEIHGPYWWSQE